MKVWRGGEEGEEGSGDDGGAFEFEGVEGG